VICVKVLRYFSVEHLQEFPTGGLGAEHGRVHNSLVVKKVSWKELAGHDRGRLPPLFLSSDPLSDVGPVRLCSRRRNYSVASFVQIAWPTPSDRVVP